MKIKIIAFDFVGVLVKEKDIKLSELQNKLERKFGSFNTDIEYYNWAEKETKLSVDKIKKETEKIINILYEIKEPNIFKQLSNYKIVLATNHLSQLTTYIENQNIFKKIEYIFNSGDLNLLKNNKLFYKIMCNKLDVKPEEILFIDDNKENIETAKSFGIETILYSNNSGILSNIIIETLKNN